MIFPNRPMTDAERLRYALTVGSVHGGQAFDSALADYDEAIAHHRQSLTRETSEAATYARNFLTLTHNEAVAEARAGTDTEPPHGIRESEPEATGPLPLACRSVSDAKSHFTLVFEGDLRALPFNPLKAATCFGRPIAARLGDMPEKLDPLVTAVRELLPLLIMIGDGLWEDCPYPEAMRKRIDILRGLVPMTEA